MAYMEDVPVTDRDGNVKYPRTTAASVHMGVEEGAKALDQLFSGNSAKDSLLLGGRAPQDYLDHKNMALNPWFTVNQRGQTEYEAKVGSQFGADGWRLDQTGMTIHDGYISLSSMKNAYYKTMRQRWEDAENPLEIGKAYTLSTIARVRSASDGTHVAIGLGLSNSGNTVYSPALQLPVSSDFQLYQKTFVIPESYPKDVWGIILVLGNNAEDQYSQVDVKAIKLEPGTVSTLQNDLPPDYGEELARCRNRFRRIQGKYTQFGMGYLQSATTACVQIPLDVAIRAPSAVTFSGTVYLWSLGGGIGDSALTSTVPPGNTTLSALQNLLYVPFYTEGGTPGDVVLATFRDSTSYLDISADL